MTGQTRQGLTGFDLVYLALLALLVFAMYRASAGVSAQERNPAYPATRQWEVASITPFLGASTGRLTVFVVDTAGVCLYVLHQDSPNWDGVHSSIVAVPKTQLPPGAGCQ